jgi:hypothetical protein
VPHPVVVATGRAPTSRPSTHAAFITPATQPPACFTDDETVIPAHADGDRQRTVRAFHHHVVTSDDELTKSGRSRAPRGTYRMTAGSGAVIHRTAISFVG